MTVDSAPPSLVPVFANTPDAAARLEAASCARTWRPEHRDLGELTAARIGLGIVVLQGVSECDRLEHALASGRLAADAALVVLASGALLPRLEAFPQMPDTWDLLEWPPEPALLAYCVARQQRRQARRAQRSPAPLLDPTTPDVVAPARPSLPLLPASPAALAQASRQLDAALEAANLCLFTLEPESERLHLQGPALRLFGSVPGTLTELAACTVAEEREWVMFYLRSSAAASRALEFSFRVARDAAEPGWMQISCAPVREADTAALVIQGRIADLSDLRRTEAARRELVDRLSIALDAAGLNPWTIDLQANSHSGGPRDVELFGCEIRTQEDFLRIIHPDDEHRVAPLRDTAQLANGDVVSVEYRICRPDGEVRWLASKARCVFDDLGLPHKLIGVTSDISMLKRAEQALRESRQQLENALSAGRMLLWRWRRGTGFRIEFGLASEIFGAGDIPTRTFVERIHPEDRGRVFDAFARAVRDATPYDDHYRVLDAAGQLRWVQVQGTPISAEAGEAASGQQLWGLLIDITERRSMERRLVQTTRRLVHALDAAGVVAFEFDPFGVLHSGRLEDVPEFGPIHPEDRPGLEDALRTAAHLDGSISHGYRVLEPGRGIAWRRAVGRAEAADGGAGIRLTGVVIDESQQHLREAAIREGRHWRELAVEGVGLSIWEIDLDTGVRVGSQTDRLRFGFVPASFDEITALIHPDDLTAALPAWQASVDSDSPFAADLRFRQHDACYRWTAVRARPLRNPATGARRMVGISMDIDDIRRAELEQREALRLARQASESKSAFLASMSHEIRTPLNAVIGFTGLLGESALDAQQRGYVGTLAHSAQQLLGLINDVLDFSRIEAGEMPLEAAPFSLLDCVETSIDFVAPMAESKGLCLAGTVQGPADLTVTGDVTRVRQIVVNLLSNAVKFTTEGLVHCELATERTGETLRTTFTVRDTGIGMSVETVSRLFRPFQQGDASTTRRFGGTGLGLSISHRLASLMGGVMDVSSEPGSGSVFTLSLVLPLAETRAESRLVPERARRAGLLMRSRWMNDVVAAQLRALQMEVTVLDAEAPHTWRACTDAGLDLLVTGQAMLDELEACRPYPTDRSGASMPVVVLSRLRDETRLRTGAHGQRVVSISRNLKPSKLIEAVLRVTGAAGGSEPPLSESAGQAARVERLGPSLRILAAEDNAVNQTLLRLQLESLGHRVQIVASGIEALQALEIASFDVILMDVEMPGLDGIETSRAVRTLPDEASRSIYIVAVTAHATLDMKRRLRDAGIDDFVPKPVLRESLLAALERAAQSRPVAGLAAQA